jgi:hypothetical protein
MIEISVLSRSIRHASVAGLLGIAILGTSREVEAKPGTHPIVVSTWDTRASSVLLQYRHGFLDDGGFNIFSYNANFSATSGKLSAQFGVHYLNYDEPGDSPKQHGLAGTANAVFNFPVAPRYDNGLARVGIALYFGSAPTALISGERNYLSIPFLLGAGVPVTPHKAITITPWFEFSPGVNLDTVINDFSFENEDPEDYINLETNTIELDQADIERVLSESVELDVSFGIGARAGLDLALHASDRVDFNVNASLSSVGTAFTGTSVVYVGGGLVFRWDDIVPAVLPPEKRLLSENCDDIEARFRSCPNRARWKTPEEIETTPPPASPPAPLAPSPAPLAPSPAPPPPAAEPLPGTTTPLTPPPPNAPPAAPPGAAFPPANSP